MADVSCLSYKCTCERATYNTGAVREASMRVRTFPCFHFLLFAVATDDTLPAALGSRLGVCVV